MTDTDETMWDILKSDNVAEFERASDKLDSGKRALLPHTLIVAVAAESVKIVAYILSQPDCNVNCMSEEFGGTPLHFAARVQSVDVINILLSHPLIDVNCQTRATSNTYFICGATPLMIATDAQIVDRLLAEKDLDLDQRCADGSTALIEFGRNNAIHLCRRLVNAGANWRLTNDRGFSFFNSMFYEVVAFGVTFPGAEKKQMVLEHERRKLTEFAIGLAALDWPVLVILIVAQFVPIGGSVRGKKEHLPSETTTWNICKYVKSCMQQRAMN